MVPLLVECSIRATLAAGATGCLLAVFGIRRAADRHAAWTAVAAAMLLLLVWTPFGPKARWSVARTAFAPVMPVATVGGTDDAGRGVPARRQGETVPARRRPSVALTIECVWLAGFCIFAARLLAGTMQARALRRTAEGAGPFRTSRRCSAPVTVGWIAPVILLPRNWRTWSAAELDCVLAHEGAHARRRDPLWRWLALLNRAVFWFHPLAWLIERWIAELAEQACDDAAVERGADRAVYCQALLRFAREMAADGARVRNWGATMAGPSLAGRVRRVLEAKPQDVPSPRARVCASLAGAVAIATLVTGSIGAAELAFDVASIRPGHLARMGGEGSRRERVSTTPKGVDMVNFSVAYCIQWAYGVKFYQLSGPAWMFDDRFDIAARTDQVASPDQLRLMARTLIAERFRWRFHKESRTRPVYALVTRKDGPQLQASEATAEFGVAVAGGAFRYRHVTMYALAEQLSDLAALGRPVVDRTGLEGVYDISLRSAARATRDDPEAVFTALEEFGLRLEPDKAPIEYLVTDHVERPSAN